jgi:hypothetical protein
MTGDCFVILASNGLYWDGYRRVAHWEQAQRFAGPDDPRAEAQVLADQLRRAGRPCNVAYIPRPKVTRRQKRGPDRGP